jgi:holo-[acyl-carrier protein] synthase
MIYGIGQDIVENARIKRVLDLYGERFINKVLSKSEQLVYAKRKNKVQYIAKRFAAKEAFSKACGMGFRNPILMPRISVLNEISGKPIFVFDETINRWLKERKINGFHVSLSDEVNTSTALVILETN